MLVNMNIYEIIQICFILCCFKVQYIHKDKKISNRLALNLYGVLIVFTKTRGPESKPCQDLLQTCLNMTIQ